MNECVRMCFISAVPIQWHPFLSWVNIMVKNVGCVFFRCRFAIRTSDEKALIYIYTLYLLNACVRPASGSKCNIIIMEANFCVLFTVLSCIQFYSCSWFYSIHSEIVQQPCQHVYVCIFVGYFDVYLIRLWMCFFFFALLSFRLDVCVLWNSESILPAFIKWSLSFFLVNVMLCDITSCLVLRAFQLFFLSFSLRLSV